MNPNEKKALNHRQANRAYSSIHPQKWKTDRVLEILYHGEHTAQRQWARVYELERQTLEHDFVFLM